MAMFRAIAIIQVAAPREQRYVALDQIRTNAS
jgi:hypothetical protein